MGRFGSRFFRRARRFRSFLFLWWLLLRSLCGKLLSGGEVVTFFAKYGDDRAYFDVFCAVCSLDRVNALT
jgi:hypothetical protein